MAPATPAERSSFTTELAPEYRARRDALRGAFPAGLAFLSALEAMCTPDSPFHLGTAKNLHLYVGNRFLCYIKMEKPTALLLSPVPNVSIKVGTHSDSGCLFHRPIEQLVRGHKGFSAGWARQIEDRFKIVPGAPEAFFAALLDLIKSVE